MRVILLKKIKNLGDPGKVIDIKSGYARNFLIPNRQVILATKKNIEVFQEKKIAIQKKLEKELLLVSARIKTIKSIGSVDIYSKSGKKGKLFGSIGLRDIIKSLVKLGVQIDKRELKLPNGVLRTIGQHIVVFQPHKDISINLIVNVISKN